MPACCAKLTMPSAAGWAGTSKLRTWPCAKAGLAAAVTASTGASAVIEIERKCERLPSGIILSPCCAPALLRDAWCEMRGRPFSVTHLKNFSGNDPDGVSIPLDAAADHRGAGGGEAVDIVGAEP